MPPDTGVVRGSPDFGSVEYITIPNTDSSAYFATIHKAYQDSVNTSDSIKRQRASLQTTVDTMKEVNTGLAALGNRYSVENGKQVWSAADGDGAYDVAYSLAMAGTAPATVTGGWNGPFWAGSDLTNLGASFYYFDGDAWQHVTNATPEVGRSDPGEVAGLSWTNAKGTLNEGWTYNGNAVFAYPPSNLNVVEFTPPAPGLALAFPGTYLHETGTDRYYLVIPSKELQAMPNQSPLAYAPYSDIVPEDITDSTDISSLPLGTFVKKDGIYYRVGETSPNTLKPVDKPDFVIQDITAETDLNGVLPGTVVRMKQSSGDKFYIVSVDHKLVAAPSAYDANFFPTYLKASQDEAEQWKRAIKAAHDTVATLSQTQSEYLLSLAGSLQASLSLVTNLVERFERVYSSLVDRT